ncbi:hypothetical protein SDC9_135307 [bioreactor metagenome]|uniref:Uncharacterized protein n=1 Tax=bioreactor metagenome TaxID=1076179 RepID=A0A645DFT4_9ZZZZ
MDILDGILQQRPQILLWEGCAGRLGAVWPRNHLHLAQNHIRVVNEIAVHLDAVIIRGEVYPLRLYIHHAVTFLQK